jgi:hypothetical protein
LLVLIFPTSIIIQRSLRQEWRIYYNRTDTPRTVVRRYCRGSVEMSPWHMKCGCNGGSAGLWRVWNFSLSVTTIRTAVLLELFKRRSLSGQRNCELQTWLGSEEFMVCRCFCLFFCHASE